jgi:hypothetical protein
MAEYSEIDGIIVLRVDVKLIESYREAVAYAKLDDMFRVVEARLKMDPQHYTHTMVALQPVDDKAAFVYHLKGASPFVKEIETAMDACLKIRLASKGIYYD